MQAWLGLERMEVVPAGDLGPALAAWPPQSKIPATMITP